MLLCLAGSCGASVTLVEGGQAVAAIHTPAEATITEQFAAEELQKYIAKATGASLVLEAGAPADDAPAIIVAQVDRLGLLSETATEAELALDIEGIANRTAGQHLIIAGGGPRGVVYAAYNFLESLGYRWYWPGELGEVTPALAAITVENLALAREPSFARRHAIGRAGDAWADVQWGLDVLDWLTKNHQNFWVRNPPEDVEADHEFMTRRGGSYTKVGSGHNWQHILPAKTYFADHPEWYPEINGKRQAKGQLCLSNPEVIDRLTEYAMAGAAEMAANPDIMFIDMTQNDGAGWCECDACRAIDDRDKSTHADILLYALNQVAERVTAKYPDALLHVYIYAGAAGIPNWITPHPSLHTEQTNYCYNYGASFLNPDAPRGNVYKQQIDALAPVTNHHGIYEYFGFYNWLEALPVTLYRLSAEVPYYKQLGVEGFYSETESHWATNHLLYYAFSRLWWDADTDVPAMLDEFFRLFFGPAEDPMRNFYLALETSGGPDRYWSGNEFDLPKIYPPKLRADCRGWLDEAKTLAANDETISARLAFIELGWRYTELHLEAMAAHDAYRRAPSPEGKQAALAAWQAYVDYFEQLQGTHAFADRGLAKFHARGQKQLAGYSFDMTALPAGEFSYNDSLLKGGNARLHGRVTGFYDGTWGLSLRKRGSGTVTYEVGARAGQTWTAASFGFNAIHKEGLSNAVEYSVDGKNWTAVAEDKALDRNDNFDISEAVAGKARFWIRARYESTLDKDQCALTRVWISGEIR
jgi:hypothetical protein